METNINLLAGFQAALYVGLFCVFVAACDYVWQCWVSWPFEE